MHSISWSNPAGTTPPKTPPSSASSARRSRPSRPPAKVGQVLTCRIGPRPRKAGQDLPYQAWPRPQVRLSPRRPVLLVPPAVPVGISARRGPGKPEVIAIGISTGGPPALTRMLPQLPADLAAAVLIVQHMPPKFTLSLANDLAGRCQLSVAEAADGDVVQPGRILIAPGGRQMKILRQAEDGPLTIRITDDPPENHCRPSVDYLFRSVAHTCGGRAVGVIMTGMGSDGTLGCRLLKRQGAAIIAQDEATCVVFGMPKQPVEEGLADAVLPLDRIAGQIARLAGRGGSRAGNRGGHQGDRPPGQRPVRDRPGREQGLPHPEPPVHAGRGSRLQDLQRAVLQSPLRPAARFAEQGHRRHHHQRDLVLPRHDAL